MKKILTFLTGIVFVMTILVTGGCRNGNKPNDPTKAANDSTIVANDSTKVEIYLKALLQDGRMHLEMYNEKHPEKKVVDSLYTDVRPGYTVFWKKVKQSGIKNINHIRPINPIKENGIFSDSTRLVGDQIQLPISPDAKPGTEKYEIVFTDENDIIWCIDPYLRIPNN